MKKEILDKNTILLSVHGSQAYGTNVKGSDTDLRGIAIPPKEYFLGWLNTFYQAESKDPDDMTIFDIRKYFKLASDCNPNVLEILYTDDKHIRKITPIGEKLRANRDLFLSSKCKFTFCGYAISQLKRIKTHRKWLLEPPTHQPTREEFGLPSMSKLPKDQLNAIMTHIQKVVDGWKIPTDNFSEDQKIFIKDSMTSILTEMELAAEEKKIYIAAKHLNLDDDFIELIQKEKRYLSAKRYWVQYNEWKTNRNEARAKLEKQYGFDSKHGMHLVRLLRTGKELLTEGKLHVYRPDREELLAIRNGAWTYDELIDYAEKIEEELNVIYNSDKSVLPKQPDRNKLDKLCIELVEEHLGVSYASRVS